MAATAEHLTPGQRPPRPALRLVTRPRRRGVPPRVIARRRLTVLLGLVALVTVAALMVRAEAGGGGMEGSSTATATPRTDVVVVVEPGDTVWDLARTYGPEGMDLAAYATQFLAANDVEATALRPGTVLRLP